MDFPMHLPGEDFINSWWPIVIAIAIGAVVGFRNYMRGAKNPSLLKITDKTVIVTGASSGIGKETAKMLLYRGARVILACRDEEKGKAVEEELKTVTKKTDKVKFMKLDLSSAKSVREFVDTFLESENRLDILINNAGVMCNPEKTIVDGVELQFATNYLGHFLLTHLLLDELKSAPSARIINVSAPAYKIGQIDMEDLKYEQREYKPGEAFSASKLAVVLSSIHLSKVLEGTKVTVNVAHPGIADTDIYRHMPFKQSKFISMAFAPFMYLLMKRADDAAQTIVYLAVAKEEEGVSGKYFSECHMDDFVEDVKDDEMAEKLYNDTLKLVKIKE